MLVPKCANVNDCLNIFDTLQLLHSYTFDEANTLIISNKLHPYRKSGPFYLNNKGKEHVFTLMEFNEKFFIEYNPNKSILKIFVANICYVYEVSNRNSFQFIYYKENNVVVYENDYNALLFDICFLKDDVDMLKKQNNIANQNNALANTTSNKGQHLEQLKVKTQKTKIQNGEYCSIFNIIQKPTKESCEYINQLITNKVFQPYEISDRYCQKNQYYVNKYTRKFSVVYSEEEKLVKFFIHNSCFVYKILNNRLHLIKYKGIAQNDVYLHKKIIFLIEDVKTVFPDFKIIVNKHQKTQVNIDSLLQDDYDENKILDELEELEKLERLSTYRHNYDYRLRNQYVKSYRRKDGTLVKAYKRSSAH